MKPYLEEDLLAAIEAVGNGASQREASSEWGIPRSTLQNRLHGTQSQLAAAEPQMRLSPLQESKLVEFALTQAMLGLPMTHFELRVFAARMTTSQTRPPPLGKRWLAAFLTRNPEIKGCRARGMHSSRTNGATITIIRDWFAIFRLPAIAKIKPENRHNADEGGIAEGDGLNGIVLGPAGRRVVIKRSNGSRVWTSFIECISATGKACPPLIIFKGKTVQQQWFKSLEGLQHWEFTATPNGWTNNDIALEWLKKIFIPQTEPREPNEWRLLVLDGHKSHTIYDFMWLCFMSKIYCVYLPPHTSHVLQPLDVGVFSSLKTAYRREAGLVNLYTDNTLTGKQLFLYCYQKARLTGLKESHIRNGWRGTGLWPVNMAKPLMSRLLVENTNKTASSANSGTTNGFRRSELVSQDSIMAKGYLLATPLASRDVRAMLANYDLQEHSISTQRILFRKVSKAYDEKDWQLESVLRENQKLKDQLEATAPTKRRRVETSPNSRFVDIAAIQRAQIEARAIEVGSEHEEGSNQSVGTQECIEVGSVVDDGDDEVEG